MLCDGFLGNLIKAMSRRCEAMFGCSIVVKLCIVEALKDVAVGCQNESWFWHASWNFDTALLWYRRGRSWQRKDNRSPVRTNI